MNSQIRKYIASFIITAFVTSLITPTKVGAQGVFSLPAVGSMITPSAAFSPAIITGMTIHPENPLQFDFIVDTGDDRLQGENLKAESSKLINYFMATLTVPENEMWVNLSPYEKNRIVADGLSKTEMGRDMLAQDYLLKQLTASLMYPEGKVGQEFWERVYAKAQETLNTKDIPTDLFNKVWIVPQEASVYVNGNNIFVVDSHLKVMLEQDYLALEENQGTAKHGLGNVTKDDVISVTGTSAQLIREVILPEIEKEVNEGKNFANLRQIYNSMILATWYKKKLKNSVIGQIYLDKNKTNGIELEDKTAKEKIYNQYLEAFKKGVYNYIKEDYDAQTQEVVARKYFSGGLEGVNSAMVAENTGVVPDKLLARTQRSYVGVPVRGDLIDANGNPYQNYLKKIIMDFSSEDKSILDLAMVGDEENLSGVLGTYITRLEGFAQTLAEQKTNLPIDELVLYLKVLQAMYMETIERWKLSSADHHYVHENRLEFANELAYHPRLQGYARRMMDESYAGAFRVLAEQFGGGMDSLSSLEEMMSVMNHLVKESSMHPELRKMALTIINDPKTYGLDERDFAKADIKNIPAIERKEEAGAAATSQFSGSIKDLMGALLQRTKGKKEEVSSNPEIAGSDELVVQDDSTRAKARVKDQALEFAAVSEGLVKAAEEKEERTPRNKLKPNPDQVVRVRAARLLLLADGSVNDDPQMAEAALREYSRLLKVFDQVDFYVAVTLDKHKNVMTSQALRPVLIELARSVPDKEDGANMLTQIATQLIREKDYQGALNLLEEIKTATFYTFSDALGQLVDILFATRDRNEKMIEQLERIINSIPEKRGNADESKISLQVQLGQKYAELGITRKANNYYKKAWKASEMVAQPAITRLKYFVPLMREKGIKFSLSRENILAEVRVIAESDLSKRDFDARPDKMITLAREYAFNRDYQKAEEAAQYINDHMKYPRDHYDHVYGAIIESATLYGDDHVATDASFKMTNYKNDHWDRAAELLIAQGNYQKALEISRFGSHWGTMRIVRNIIERDENQIGLIRTYLEGIIGYGLDSFNLESMVELISEYPALDPDGKFIVRIFQSAFEQNRSIIASDSHRIILQNLRKIILAQVKTANPSLLRLPDVFGQVNKALPAPSSETEDKSGDSASLGSKEDLGGIDFNSNNLNLKEQGQGANINFSFDNLQNIQPDAVNGILPVIINITPVTNFPALLGLSQTNRPEQLTHL